MSKVVVGDHYAGNRLLACVGVVDFGTGDPLSTAKINVFPLDFCYPPQLADNHRLIGSPSGDLLLAQSILSQNYRMSVFQVDLHAAGNLGGSEGRQKVLVVTGLGSDRALLVGYPCSMAVSAQWAPQLKGNFIYWIPEGGRLVMKVFSFDP